MLVSQICNLGKSFLSSKIDHQNSDENTYNKTQYEVLINSQKEYKQKYFVLVSVNFQEPDKIDFSLIEYDYEKRYNYCRGLISGSGVNLSLSINIKWDDLKEKNYENNPNSIINLSNKIGKIVNNISLNDYNNTYVEKFFNCVYPNGDFNDISFLNKIKIRIIDYLTELKSKNLPKKDLPSLIIFGIKENIETRFPGEFEEFRRLYLELDAKSKIIKRDLGIRYCFICGNEAPHLLPFNWGFFTLDKDSFNIGFQNEESQNQYLICSECELYCIEGLNILEKYLRFYAFSIKKGAETIGVYHYLIPNCLNLDELKNKVHSISNIKKLINERKSEDISLQIEDLNYRIEKANREKKRELQKIKNELQKKRDPYKNNENISIDLIEILEEFDKIDLSFIDLYFRYIDKKQNPPTKEIFDVYFISKTQLGKLSEIFKEIKKKNQLKDFYFWWLKDLVNNSNYFYFLEALYNNNKINYSDFVNVSFQNLKKAFKNKVFSNKSTFFNTKIKNFKIFYDLFESAKILELN